MWTDEEMRFLKSSFGKGKEFASDPVHQHEDGKWWFWCEDWASREGPFESEVLAREALSKYCNQL